MARRDVDDFVAFAEACRVQMRRTAFLMSGDWDRAADITQEALIRLYVAWPRLDKDAGLRSYARRTVVSVAVDFARKRSSTEVPGATPTGQTVADPTVGVTDRMVLMQALAQLPARQRACVVLRYYEDLSVEDVAEALGCRAGTVKSQTARGLAALRTVFRSMAGDAVADSDLSGEARTW